MPTMVCERCRRHLVRGVLSGQAWLEYEDGDGRRRYICPECRAELSEEQRTAFVRTGFYDSQHS